MSWKQATVLMQCEKKNLKQRNLEPKQQKRFYEWDLAKISQLSAKRPEQRFWFKEEKKCVNPGNQHKRGSRCNTAEIQRRKSKNFLLSEIQLESMWKASNRRKPFPVRKNWTQCNLAPQQQKHFFEWNMARISVISWKQARTFMPWKKSYKSVIWTQKSKNVLLIEI